VSSLILETGTRAVFHMILLFSLYLLFAGHNAPGGGFVGGLVAGAAFVLRYVAEGPDDLGRLVRVPPEAVLGLGVVFAAGTGMGGWLFGAPYLSGGSLELQGLPVFGDVKVTAALPFDIGVYLVVVGMVLMILRTLGGEMDA
jgi:multicomponent Na+:H+ antiporter subunit A